MRRSLVYTVVNIAIAGVFLLAYSVRPHRVERVPAASQNRIAYYACPMHPSYRSDHPGTAGCCGMRLEPIYAGATPVVNSHVVSVSTDQQQLVRLQTAEVRRRSTSATLRLPSRVAID